MFIIPSIDLSMKLSLSEDFVSNIIVTMVISNKSCCKYVLFMNLSNVISTITRVTSVKYKNFLFCSFSVAMFGIAPRNIQKPPTPSRPGNPSNPQTSLECTWSGKLVWFRLPNYGSCFSPLDPKFANIGDAFLAEQEKEFGTNHVYSVDPFNELLPPNRLN